MAAGVDTIVSQWNFLHNLFAANMNFGPNGPGTGTNTAGLLQPVASVGKSEWPDFNALPYLGVSPASWDEVPEASGYLHKQIVTFQIVVAVNVVASAENVISLDAAYAAALAIFSDGAGNGIAPLLRNVANYHLDGSASKIILRKGQMRWADRPGGKGTDYVAYISQMLDVTNRVSSL